MYPRSRKRRRRYDPKQSTSAQQIAFADQPDAVVKPDGDRDVVTITFGTGETSGVFVPPPPGRPVVLYTECQWRL